MMKPWELKRNAVHKHNSFMGYACSIRTQARDILNSKTATNEAKQYAVIIEEYAELLAIALKQRRPEHDSQTNS